MSIIVHTRFERSSILENKSSELIIMEKESQDFKSQHLVIQKELNNFGHQVESLCDLESDCCISEEDAYQQIKNFWLQLRRSNPEIIHISMLSE